MQLLINTAQTKITVKNSCFYIQSKTLKRQISPKRITSIAISCNALINSAAIILAVENQIPIYYFNNMGEIQARMMSPYFTNLASIRHKQHIFARTSQATRFVLESLELKFSKQHSVLLSIERKYKNERIFSSKFAQIVTKEKSILKNYAEQTIDECRNNIMGIEGSISRNYWNMIARLLPEKHQFKARTRRPAKDIFNAAINYGYGMTYSIIEQAIFSVGFDPFIGLLHAENYKKTALVFDIIEPFRPYIDHLVFELFQTKEMDEKHFAAKNEGYFLNKDGKKIFIPAMRQMIESRVQFRDAYGSFRNHTLLYCNDLLKRIKTIEI